ncbi:MAG: nucleotidyltransferase domain-containing protein [Candidatus Latescibacteria bacterium]|nr:nucleotidyltransferase domain-containing protein [bacterium]MBD3423049.1 nucleotidyltransferase domain-containing protein [Candidatus Latescibacterota bacterium]
MEEIIRNKLIEIEKSEDVKICLAVESGSRAWGFPSADSDYDVRFIYIRRPRWYLSLELERKPDVIEMSENSILDMVGWDIRKALFLFYKANPPLLEWLASPCIYLEQFSLAARMREMLPAFFSEKAGFYHYLHMAAGNYSDYLKGERVILKKYFYVLRPLLAARWIESGRGSVPMEFIKLVEGAIESAELRKTIERMIEMKSKEPETEYTERIEAVDSFIREELERHEKRAVSYRKEIPDIEALNRLFVETLKEVWGVTVPQAGAGG